MAIHKKAPSLVFGFFVCAFAAQATSALASTRPVFTGSDRASALMVADGPSGDDDTNRLYNVMAVQPSSQPLGVLQKDDQSPDGRVQIECRLGKIIALASCAVVVNKGDGATIDVAKREFHYVSTSDETLQWARAAFVRDTGETFEFRSIDRALVITFDESSFRVDYKSTL